MADVVGLERRAVGHDVAHHDVVEQRGHAEQHAAVSLGQGVGLVDDEGVGEPRHAVVLHRGEVAEGVGVRQRPVLVEALLVVAPWT